MLRAHRVRSALIAATCAALVLGSGGRACASREPDTIHEAMVGPKSQDAHIHEHSPPVARYAAEPGVRFILDRSGPATLFRFEHSPEIWALRPAPAPGGDIIYKNDLSQQVLRISRLGGVTLFTSQQPMGVPAILEGEGTPYRAPILPPTVLFQILIHDSVRISRAAQRLVPINAESAPGAEYLIADAAGIATEALVQMAAFPQGKSLLDHVRRVQLRVGRHAEARFHDGEVEIVVSPKQGLAGRPSSGWIAKAMVEGD